MSIPDIVANIDHRLADLDRELTHLTGARAALLDKPARAAQSTPRRAAPPRTRRARRAPAKAGYDVVTADALIAVLTDSEGMSTRELSRQTNADPAQVLTLLKEQEAIGHVHRSGTRAATRWQAITDEDRIAARVAELEAGSRPSRARRN